MSCLSRYGTISSCSFELLRAHVHRGTWLLLLSLYPSASVLFHLRSVSFHSFEVAVREFPKKKGLLSVNCILGIVNQSEQSGQMGTIRPATHHRADTSSFPHTRPFGIWYHLPTSLQFQHAVLVFTGYICLSFPQSCPFATRTSNTRGDNYQLGIQLCLNTPGLSEQCPCPSQVYVDRPVSS